MLILLVFVIVGCNNPAKETNTVDYNLEVVSDEDVLSKEEFSFHMPAPVSNAYLDLSEQKLNELFEKAYLNSTHSGFNLDSDIAVSPMIEKISTMEFDDRPVLSNIQLIGPPKMINDSIDVITVSYQLKSGETKYNDTIKARITKRSITIDDQSLVDMELDFEFNN